MRLKPRKSDLFDYVPLTKERILSLKLVIYAVAFGVICFNITSGVAMTGYLKALGTSDTVFGLIYAIAPVASTFQVLAAFLLEKYQKRRAMFLIAGILQRTAWLPFGLVPFFVEQSETVLRIWMAVLFLSVTALTQPFMNIAFYSFVADLVPMEIRGRYFSLRSRISTALGVLGGLLTAWLLDKYTGFSGYALVFTLASLAGLVDILMFLWVKFPQMPKPEKTDSVISMVKAVVTNKKYMSLIGFVSLWSFSINLSAPFYLVQLKTEMGLSNTVITLLMQILPNICTILVVSVWGRLMDRQGNKKTVFFGMILLSAAPFLWGFTSTSIVPVVIVSIFSGLMICGIDLGFQNLFMGLSPQKNRSMFMALYLTVTSLLGIGLGNATGGWLLDNVLVTLEAQGFSLNGFAFTRYHYLFLLSALLRAVFTFGLFPKMVHNAEPAEHLEEASQ